MFAGEDGGQCDFRYEKKRWLFAQASFTLLETEAIRPLLNAKVTECQVFDLSAPAIFWRLTCPEIGKYAKMTSS